MADYDALIVGSGPNGLAAAITLARAGQRVLVIEAATTLGGGLRSRVVDGFTHDICSAIHPLALASPFFREIMPALQRQGLQWLHAPMELAHPLDDSVVLLARSLAATSQALGDDAASYHGLMAPLVRHWQPLLDETLQPLWHIPRHPVLLARFGMRALPSASLLQHSFRQEPAKALFAGLTAHSIMPLHAPGTSAIALMLATLGHAVGWGFPRGGAQALADAMLGYLASLGGEVWAECPLRDLAEIGSSLPSADAIFLDTSAAGLLAIAGERLPAHYRRRLQRFRYGGGAVKVDYQLSAPIPWRNPQTARAATVHLGGSFAEIRASEAWLSQGATQHPPAAPFVLLAQASLFDASRAPAGKHSVWAYCHVPNGYPHAMTDAITAQISRYAPGFPELILAQRTTTAPAYQQHNPNYVGGDINAGAASLWQLLARPTIRQPYCTPIRHLYLCSASTPPGGGVHGMAGYHAARAHLARCGV